jgi:hypothetical protein
MGGWVGGGMGGKTEDNGFGLIWYLQGGSIGLALLWSKKKKENFASYFTSPEKENWFFYLWCDYEAIIKKKLC